MCPGPWATFSTAHGVFLIVLYVENIEYEIVFLPI